MARDRLIGPEAEARAAKALERNRRLIEANAVDEAKPQKITRSYKPKPKKKRGARRAKRARPLSASELPQAIERLQEHWNGVRPTE
jgi:hypothetical protein